MSGAVGGWWSTSGVAKSNTPGPGFLPGAADSKAESLLGSQCERSQQGPPHPGLPEAVPIRVLYPGLGSRGRKKVGWS